MKKEEWGLMTFAGLVACYAFPPYFLALLAIAGLSSLGFVIVPQKDSEEFKKLVEFEKEFRKGHEFEEKSEWVEAKKIYEELERKFQNYPKIAQISSQRIAWINENKNIQENPDDNL